MSEDRAAKFVEYCDALIRLGQGVKRMNARLRLMGRPAYLPLFGQPSPRLNTPEGEF